MFFEADHEGDDSIARDGGVGEGAVEGVAGHLKRFWEPRMRKEILAMVDRGEVAEMDGLVVEALTGKRVELMPKG